MDARILSFLSSGDTLGANRFYHICGTHAPLVLDNLVSFYDRRTRDNLQKCPSSPAFRGLGPGLQESRDTKLQSGIPFLDGNFKKQNERGLRDGSTVKSTGDSSRGPGFNPQHPHGGSQPSLAPILGNTMPSSGFHWYQACTHGSDIHADKKPIRMK